MKMYYENPEEARVTVTDDERFMINGKEIRTLAELREHFTPADVIAVAPYLESWLENHFYEEEADAVSEASFPASDNYTEIFCRILGVETPLSKEENEEMERRVQILRQHTDDPTVLKNIRKVAFDQQDLADLIHRGEKVIYLFDNSFTIPLSRSGIRYIGIADVVIENPRSEEEYRKAGITTEGIVLPENKTEEEPCSPVSGMINRIRETWGLSFPDTSAEDDEDGIGIPDMEDKETEYFGVPSTLSEVIQKQLAVKQTLKFISFSRSDCLNCRGFHSRHECRKAGETIIKNAYNEASKYLKANSADSLARSEAEKYSKKINSTLLPIMGVLKRQCQSQNQIEVYRQISDAVNSCKRNLLAEFTKELEDNSDYYSLYNIDYFLDQLEIEEDDMRTETGILGMLEWLNPQSFEYSFDGTFEALEEIEKDINAKAASFFSVTHERYRDYVRKIEDLIDTACAGLPPMKEKEDIVGYLNRCATCR